MVFPWLAPTGYRFAEPKEIFFPEEGTFNTGLREGGRKNCEARTLPENRITAGEIGV